MSELKRALQDIMPQLALLCRRMGGNADRGDEILQRTYVRALANLDGYRGDASLMTWASTIARGERDRLFAQEIAEGRKRAPVSVDGLGEVMVESPSTGGRRQKAAMFADAARTAATTGQLRDAEAKVVLARLEQPSARWEDIGELYSLSADACAHAHCRAILSLRVYMFTHRPDLLGGMQEIEAAFHQAASAAEDPLTPDERMAFSQIIVKGARGYSRRGWREELRSACLKVSRRLEID